MRRRKNRIETGGTVELPSSEEVEGSNPETPETTVESQQVRLPERVESALSNGAERLDAKAAGVEQAIQDTESMLPPERVRSLRERFNAAVDRATETAKFLLLAAAVNNAPTALRRQRPAAERGREKVDREHKSADPETTAIINYMSGKADLPREQKTQLIIEALRGIKLDAELSQDLSKAKDLQQPKIFGDKLTSPTELRRNNELLERYVPTIPSESNFNPVLHETLWEIQKITGDPRIRFTTQRRPFYMNREHTMYITSPVLRRSHPRAVDTPEALLLEHFAAEQAHALQKHRNDELFFSMLDRDWERITNQAILEGNDPKDVNFKGALLNVRDRIAYTTPGFVEHEAHSKIEPALMEKIEGALRRMRQRRFKN